MQGAFFNRVSKMFPTPRFLAMPTTGLAITDSAVRYVQLDGPEGSKRINFFGEKVLPPQIVCGGMVEKTEELVSILKEIKDEHQISFVRASLPDELGYVFVTKLPKAEISELKTAVEVSIEENAPVKVSDVVYDYSVIPNIFEDGSLQVVVSAVPRKTIDIYSGLFETINLEVVSLVLESQANTISLVPRDEKRATMIVGVNKLNKVSIVISAGGLAIYSTVIQLMTDNMSELLQHVKKTIAYWNDHREEVYGVNTPLGEILLTGGNMKIGDYAKHISSDIGIPTKVGDVWTNVCSLNEYVPPITNVQAPAFGVAIGLAL